MKRTRVIGCGNPYMGNDGAGVAAVERLKKLFPKADAIDGGTGGIGLLGDMDGYERIIIIDAMTGIGRKKGEIKVFSDTPPYTPSQISLHDVGVSGVVEAAKTLIPGTEVITVGIEVESIKEYSKELDPEVEEGIENICTIVIKILEE
ncbi:hydrogenase maturation protease [Methanomicrobium sp. W14]|uniref:hydrogenase maturation protease n=1 Tax=Methanomicrobium sp. W14 TaxID=2817839 RepID=UPI001AE96663|nr:hydrogenase maturation protease [Methanomicrobium sp. W14]MBP2134481.1 hydrogenase maturation protease [Methanomicrobium sp. W14]